MFDKETVMGEKFDRLLIVGFDGLDYQKLQEYECGNFTCMESFGKLDLEDMKLQTPRLWATMITGVEPRVHGINSMTTFKGEKVRKWDRYVLKFFELFGLNALHLRKYLWYQIFDSGLLVPDKRFMKVDSIFDKIADSKALDIPGYTEYPYIAGSIGVGKTWRKRAPVSKKRVKRDIDAEHLYRKTELFENIGEHKVLMQHFHYPDWFQHLFTKGGRDKELYEEMDQLAGEILEEVDDETLVLFCSDHGLENGGHRDEAFYSANTELAEPVKITNLIEKCLEKVDYQEEEDAVEEVDI
jgi:predicted AlkP superfamily phosphohydrolase/phosphomutase